MYIIFLHTGTTDTLPKDELAIMRNSISEKMLPPEAQLLAVAGFFYSRRDAVGQFVYKSLKNNILPPPPPQI